MRALLFLVLVSGCGGVSTSEVAPDALTSDAIASDSIAIPAPQLDGCGAADLPGLTCDARGFCRHDAGECCTLPAPCVGPDERCLSVAVTSQSGRS